MNVYMYTHMCTYAYINMSIYIYIHIYIYMYIYIHAYKYAYKFINTDVWMYCVYNWYINTAGRRPAEAILPKLTKILLLMSTMGASTFFCRYKADLLHSKNKFNPTSKHSVLQSYSYINLLAQTVKFHQQWWVFCPSLLVKILKSKRAVIFCRRFSIELTFQIVCALCRYVAANTSQCRRVSAQCYVRNEVSFTYKWVILRVDESCRICISRITGVVALYMSHVT